VTCWGRGLTAEDCAPDKEAAQFDCGQSDVPVLEEGRFLQVSAGSLHTCAVLSDYTALCWGWDDYKQASPPPGGLTFTQIAAGDLHSCGFRTDGSIACWGSKTQPGAAAAAGFEAE